MPSIGAVSIAVLHYAKDELTQACLESIFKQEISIPHEVFVVDNGSPYPFEFTHPKLNRIVRLPEPTLNITGQNRCFEFSQTEWVMFVSNDVIMLPGCVEALLDAAQGYQDLGQVQPILWKPNRREVDNSGMSYVWPGYGIGRRALPGKDLKVQIVPSICYLMAKRTWEHMKGFKAILPCAYEDVDMGLRLGRAGYKNYVVPQAHALHYANATLGEMPLVRERFYSARYRVIHDNFTGLDRFTRLAAIALVYRAMSFLGRSNNRHT